MAGITKVFKGDFRKQTQSAAFCNRNTGELFINTPIFETFNQYQQKYILFHEAGHILLQTEDEEAADAYASKIYLEKGYPISDSVKALSKALKFNKKQDFDRLDNQFKRAAEFDLKVNNNENIKNMNIPSFNNANGEVWGEIFQNIGNGLGTLGNGAGSIIGGLNGLNTGAAFQPKGTIYQPTTAPAPAAVNKATAESEKSNTLLYVGAAVGLVVITVILYIVFKKK